MEWPLSGLRVADLSAGIAGGYCTKVLADGGAEVTKLPEPAMTAGEIAQLGRDGIIGDQACQRRFVPGLHLTRLPREGDSA